MKTGHIGSELDDFLRDEGLLAQCEAGALKRVVAWQLEQEKQRRRVSRAQRSDHGYTKRA